MEDTTRALNTVLTGYWLYLAPVCVCVHVCVEGHAATEACGKGSHTHTHKVGLA